MQILHLRCVTTIAWFSDSFLQQVCIIFLATSPSKSQVQGALDVGSVIKTTVTSGSMSKRHVRMLHAAVATNDKLRVRYFSASSSGVQTFANNLVLARLYPASGVYVMPKTLDIVWLAGYIIQNHSYRAPKD